MLASCIALALIPAAASANWTTPVPVSEAGTAATDPEIGFDLNADATVVWQSGADPSRGIRSAYRPAGGAWESSTGLIATSSNCFDPVLAVNQAGAAIVVADCASGAALMRAAYRPAGGAWGAATTIPGSGSGSEPHVAIDDAGNAVVVWQTDTETIQSAYRPAAGNWGAGGQVSPSGDVAVDPQVAISPTGAALAIWRHELHRNVSDPVVTIETTVRHGAGAWLATTTVLTPAATSTVPIAADEPQVTWNRNGNRFAVWSNIVTPGLPILQSEWGSAGDFGSWGPDAAFQSATDGSRTVEVPQVGIDAQGRAVAVWRSAIGGDFHTQASTTGYINDNWAPPVTLTGPNINGFYKPELAVAPDGRATVVWRNQSGTLAAVTRPAGGAFPDPVDITTTDFGDPEVAMDVAGDALVAWSDVGTSPVRIGVSVNDASPPNLGSVTVPSTAGRDASVSMSATAADTWSPVVLSWNFGDGSTAVGDSVSHAYSTSGARTVTVTATDAAGNVATATREITVSDPQHGELSMNVTVPKQSWKKIRKAHGIKVRCSIDAVGQCTADASLSGKVAKHLGLQRRAKALGIGAGSGDVGSAGGTAKFKVKLSRKSLAAIGKSDRSVPVTLSFSGTATGGLSAKQSQKLKIKR